MVPEYAAQTTIILVGDGVEPQMARQPIGLDFAVQLLRDRGIGMAAANKSAKTRRARVRFLCFCQFCPAIAWTSNSCPVASVKINIGIRDRCH
jgi:hypothetical protein